MATLLLKVEDALGRPWLRRAGLAGWLLAWLVAVVLLLTPLDVPAAGSADKLGHLLLFGTLAFTAIVFCRDPRRLGLLAGVTLIGGYVLELGQLLVPSRMYDSMDAVANSTGAAIGFLLALLLARGLERLSKVARGDLPQGA